MTHPKDYSAVAKGFAIHTELEEKLNNAPQDYLQREQIVAAHVEALLGLDNKPPLSSIQSYCPEFLMAEVEKVALSYGDDRPVVFINPGHLDPRAFQIFGLSAKPGSTSPIGQFGTGLKYAIAVCLRHDCNIEIELVTDPGQPSESSRKFSFSARSSTFRNSDTTEIVCTENNGDFWPLPFTLDLGKHWELWQAYRELESNVRDEGGKSGFDLHMNAPGPHTIIRVDGLPFNQVYHKKDEYFLPKGFYEEAIQTDMGFVNDRPTKSLYYKGVRVYTSDNEFLNTYDLRLNLSLTEDRTISNIWCLRGCLQSFWLCHHDEIQIFKVITAPKGTEEHNLDFTSSCFSPSEEFKTAVQRALEHAPMSLNASARKAAQVDALDERFVKPFELDALNKERLGKAIKFLKDLGYPVDKFPLRLVDVGEELAGMAKNNTIILTRLAFNRTTLYLASTILEEFFHLEYKYNDHSCAFQDFLHDEILRMGERVLERPL